MAESSQQGDEGENATSVMARAFAAPLQQRQLRRHVESAWAGYGEGWVGSLSLWSGDTQLCLRGSTVQGERVMGVVPFAHTLDAESKSRWEYPLVFAGESSNRHALAAHLAARCSTMPFVVSVLW